jgi:hypothetical protein
MKEILEARCEGGSRGWVWMSRYKGKHIREGMVAIGAGEASRGTAARTRPLFCAPRLRQLRVGEYRKPESCYERYGPR